MMRIDKSFTSESKIIHEDTPPSRNCSSSFECWFYFVTCFETVDCKIGGRGNFPVEKTGKQCFRRVIVNIINDELFW